MESMRVDFEGGGKFRVKVRGHEFVSDQPKGRGEDSGPTPPELFISSLGTCIAIYLVFFAERHPINLEGMSVDMAWEKAERPERIAAIQAKITIPAGVPDQYREALLKSAHRCLIHNTLKEPPQIEIMLH